MRLVSVWVTTCIVALSAAAIPVYADVSYNTYTLDSNGHFIQTQTSYTPIGVVDGSNFPGNEQFSSPEDICIDRTDTVYIADTGNSRVVVLDKYGRYLRTIGQNVLSQPTGVYVDNSGNLFVADSGNDCVYKFNHQGRLVHTYSRPNSILFGASTPFVPEKVVTDNEGNLFIVSDGSIQGLIELSPQGAFEGYFGGNRVGFNLGHYLQRMFYTKAQLSQLQTILPTSPTNVAVDSEGLIYTVTSGLPSEVIKRLNISGNNLLPGDMFTPQDIADITIDKMGNIYAVDFYDGAIFEYDPDGRLLSVFGGPDNGSERLGLFESPSGIAVSSDGRLFVLDKELGDLQIFQPTEFTQLEHKAIGLYLDGKYTQSIQPWTQVLRLNSMLSIAHVGIGMADYKRGDYTDALTEFTIANDRADYSNAYWEIRREWMLKHLSTVLIGLVVLWVVISILRRLYRKHGFGQPIVNQWRRIKQQRLVAELWHAFRVMRHPIDGFYELRREGKVSILSATLLLIAFFLVHLFGIFKTNFLFNDVDTNNVSILSQLYKVLLPLFAWMVCNYLVASINDGEGRFRDVYVGTIYALSPYIVFAIPVAVLSQALTNMELVVYHLARDGMLLWCALCMFIMVKEVHSYEIGETVRNIVVSLIGMIILALLAFILFGLSNQVLDFAHSVAQEVILRVSQ